MFINPRYTLILYTIICQYCFWHIFHHKQFQTSERILFTYMYSSIIVSWSYLYFKFDCWGLHYWEIWMRPIGLNQEIHPGRGIYELFISLVGKACHLWGSVLTTFLIPLFVNTRNLSGMWFFFYKNKIIPPEKSGQRSTSNLWFGLLICPDLLLISLTEHSLK